MLIAVVVVNATADPALLTLVTNIVCGKYVVVSFTGTGVKATAFKLTPFATPNKRRVWFVVTLLGCADTVVAGPGLLILCFPLNKLIRLQCGRQAQGTKAPIRTIHPNVLGLNRC